MIHLLKRYFSFLLYEHCSHKRNDSVLAYSNKKNGNKTQPHIHTYRIYTLYYSSVLWRKIKSSKYFKKNCTCNQFYKMKTKTFDTYSCISRNKINTDLHQPLVYLRTSTIENLLLMD